MSFLRLEDVTSDVSEFDVLIIDGDGKYELKELLAAITHDISKEMAAICEAAFKTEFGADVERIPHNHPKLIELGQEIQKRAKP